MSKYIYEKDWKGTDAEEIRTLIALNGPIKVKYWDYRGERKKTGFCFEVYDSGCFRIRDVGYPASYVEPIRLDERIEKFKKIGLKILYYSIMFGLGWFIGSFFVDK